MKNYKPVEVYPLIESREWMKLTGELPVKMTNDYRFRALLQSDNDTLKALLASLLHVDVEDIRTAVVMNPIMLGAAIGDKTFIMDVKVEMNDASQIDLEMQVIREVGWTDRSLSYICRSFDQLNQGMAYIEAKPVRQIAFCDFTLFSDYPEFYSTYKLINVRDTNQVYTEKFIISNVNLTRPDLATEEDKKYKLDEWCSFFKATSWEELKMLAENNTTIGKAVSGVWQLTKEEMIREQCRAREEWLINDKWKTDTIARLSDENARQDKELKSKDKEIKSKEKEIESKDKEIKSKDEEIEALRRRLEALEKQE